MFTQQGKEEKKEERMLAELLAYYCYDDQLNESMCVLIFLSLQELVLNSC